MGENSASQTEKELKELKELIYSGIYHDEIIFSNFFSCCLNNSCENKNNDRFKPWEEGHVYSYISNSGKNMEGSCHYDRKENCETCDRLLKLAVSLYDGSLCVEK